ncbi:protein Fmp27p, mitochondrial [[Candida] jaroonii]|uniref:Protein Fmp27p, mitochondrial n=1 Tax=[Candida] jaroonii TaxID=467808 RepID=A0ACA9Y143_9ASCO|nr:protein Fmp27p, mitochondrial [[Candida] jaroonii]
MKHTYFRFNQQIIYLEYISINSESRYSKQNSNDLKFKSATILNHVKIYNKDAKEEEFPIISIDNHKFDSKFVIDLTTGLLNKIRFQMFVDNFKTSVFKLIKIFLNDIIESFEPKDTEKSSINQEKFEAGLKYLRLLYTNIDEISLLIENFNVLELPIITNQPISELLNAPFPRESLEFSTKSINFNVIKLSNESAGFHTIFNHNDIPINFSNAIQAFVIKYSTITQKGDLVSKSSVEVLNLPNYSINFKGNVFDRLTKGEGFKDCKIEIFLTCSNPILDLDSHILSLFIFNIVTIQKYFKFKKLYGIYKKVVNHQPIDFIDGEEQLQKSLFKDKLWNYLQEYYPSLDVKFVIEQPRIIIKHPVDKIQLVNFQYSSLMLQVFTNKDRSYDVSCQILHPSVNYIENFENFELFSINDINTKVEILKNLKFNIGVSLMRLRLDLSNIDAIEGIQSLLMKITEEAESTLKSGSMLSYLDQKISKYDRIVSKLMNQNKSHKSLADKIFNYLPDWLVDFKLTLSEISFIFASQSVISDVKDSRCMGINLHEFQTTLKNENTLDSEKSSTSDTLTESYWSSHSQLEDFKFLIKEEDWLPFIKLPSINVDVNAHKLLDINVLIDQVTGDVDYFKLFTIVGSLQLLTKIIEPLKILQSKLPKSEPKPKSSSSIKDLLNIDCKFKKTDIQINLHDDYKLKFDFFQTKLNYHHDLCLYNKFGRVLTESPTLEGYWSRMVCLDDLKLRYLLNTREIMVNSEFIKLIHPHQHVTYKLFDNLSITIKVLKHLFAILKNPDVDKKNVYPSKSKPRKLPHINIKTSKLLFVMEDDPFESELNMIFQLGKIEQQKRSDLLQVFEETAEKNRTPPDQIEEALEKLTETISASWIRKVKGYKAQLNEEIIKTKRFLFGNEAKLESKFQHNIQPYSLHAPLLTIIMNDLNLNITSPRFQMNELPQFLYDIGQGQPKDTEWSLNVPTYLDLKLGELRMHLRDYPLPLLFVPKKKSHPSVQMSGHLVIGEALVDGDEHIRNVKCDLVRGDDKNYSINIFKTLTSVKLFTDLEVSFDSHKASRFVWGQSYQFGIQQVMLNFEQFSKPPIDPSGKLGFWDKLRLIMHGKFRIECNNGPLEVAFKGSRDPYEIFDEGTGFILSFKDNVVWTINENDDSREFCNVNSENITWYIPNYLAAPMVSWCNDSSRITYFPDCKDFVTSSYGYYLNDDNYCNSKNYNPDNNFEKKVVNLSGGVKFTVGFVLQRDIDGEKKDIGKPHYDVKLFNPEFTDENHDSYTGFRSDYINMAISLDANFSESYNTIHLSPTVFSQFFNWWKLFASNLQLPIRKGKLFGEVKKSTKFSQHLITNRFKFNLKSLFISHIYREENLNNEDNFIQCWGLRGKMNDFIVDLHQRKEERISVNKSLSRNLKVKKMNFHIADVHLNGIDLRIVSAKFDHDIYKTSANVNPNIDYKIDNSKDSKYKIFDNDKQWFDIEDYQEAFVPSLAHCKRIITILPLLYSQRFSYLRDTEPDGRFKEQDLFQSDIDVLEQSKKVFKTRQSAIKNRIKQLKYYVKRFGESKDLNKRIEVLNKELDDLKQEELNYTNHDRRMSISNVNAKFSNKFVLLHMLLKWNNSNRNLLNKYLHYVKLLRLLRRYLSYESISIVEEIIERANKWDDSAYSLANSRNLNKVRSGPGLKLQSCQDRIDNFDDILSKISNNESLTQDYLFEIISPQIQLQSEESKDSVVLITTPHIDGKVNSIYEKGNDKLTIGLDELETRFGVLLQNANVFVFKKDDDIDNKVFDENCYGSTSNWPPWLGYEISKDSSLAGKQNVLIENISSMVTMIDQKPFGSSLARNDEEEEDNDSDYFDADTDEHKLSASQSLRVDIPKVIITSTASQYFTLYSIVTDLLIYTEPSNKEYLEKLEKLKFSNDFQNLPSVYDRITKLHKYFYLVKFLNRNYNFRQANLDNEQLNDYLELQLILQDIQNEINLLMHSILTGNVELNDNEESNSTKAEFAINADEIILHMLEDDRSPIIDIAMAKGKFKRSVNVDDSNVNSVEVRMLQGFNLLPKARFPAFLEPLQHDFDHQNSEDNLITINWSVHQDVGGIKLIDNFEVNSKPLSLRMDESTGIKLMNYIFQTDISNIDESPLLDKKKDDEEEQEEVEEIENSDEEDDEDKAKLDEKTSTIGKRRSQILGSKSFTHSSTSDEDYDEQLDNMVLRSKKYISVNHLVINPVSLSVSLKLKGGYKRLLNVTDFKFLLPELRIHKRIMSVLEITMLLKKLVTKAILGHLGGLVKNKMTIRKNPTRIFDEPLKPLKRYVNFTSINELRGTATNDKE